MPGLSNGVNLTQIANDCNGEIENFARFRLKNGIEFVMNKNPVSLRINFSERVRASRTMRIVFRSWLGSLFGLESKG